MSKSLFTNLTDEELDELVTLDKKKSWDNLTEIEQNRYAELYARVLIYNNYVMVARSLNAMADQQAVQESI